MHNSFLFLLLRLVRGWQGHFLLFVLVVAVLIEIILAQHLRISFFLRSLHDLLERLVLLEIVEFVKQIEVMLDLGPYITNVSGHKLVQIPQQRPQHDVLIVVVQAEERHVYAIRQFEGVVGHLGVQNDDVFV